MSLAGTGFEAVARRDGLRLLPLTFPWLGATGHNCSGPRACGLGESGSGPGETAEEDGSLLTMLMWGACVFLRRLRVQFWRFSFSP